VLSAERMQVAAVLALVACLSTQHSYLSTLIGAVGPGAVLVGVDGLVVQAFDDFGQGQVALHRPAVDLVDRGHFRIGPRHQDHPVGLQVKKC
jgi:hypothetical protein